MYARRIRSQPISTSKLRLNINKFTAIYEHSSAQELHIRTGVIVFTRPGDKVVIRIDCRHFRSGCSHASYARANSDKKQNRLRPINLRIAICYRRLSIFYSPKTGNLNADDRGCTG